MPSKPPMTIVLVEDDPGQARLIERNLRRAYITNDIVTRSDGQQAVDYLFKECTYAGAAHALPLLLLLDVNLPGLDGYQALTCLKADDRTRHIPIIILTTTEEPSETERCYALGCNIYLTKSVEHAQFAWAIRQLSPFFSIVKLPRGE